MEDMANLAVETKDMGFQLEQVQGFTPTPMTVATIIYYTGLHPYTLKPVYTAKSKQEKKNQHLFFFWYKRENHQQIRERLTKIGREDMIEKLIEDKKKFNKREVLKKRNSTRSKKHSSKNKGGFNKNKKRRFKKK